MDVEQLRRTSEASSMKQAKAKVELLMISELSERPLINHVCQIL